MTREEAIEMREALSEVAQYLPDKKALQYSFLFPQWTEKKQYEANFKILYQDKLYRTLQVHIANPRWTPPEALGVLYEEVKVNAPT